MERRELRGDLVVLRAQVGRSGLRRHRELLPVAHPRIEEPPLPVHLRDRNVGVPVRDRAPPRVRVQVDARQTERRGQDRRAALPVGPERLAVLVQLGVVLPGAPAPEDLAHVVLGDAEGLRDRLDGRRERHDGAHVEVPVRPPIQPPPDPLRERVVHRRVAERAGDPHGHDLLVVELRLHPDDGVGAKELERRLRVVEAHRPVLEHLANGLGNLPDVHLQPELQRLARREPLANAAVFLSRDRLVETELPAPVRLTPEGVLSEDLLPFLQHLPRVLVDLLVPRLAGALRLDRRIGLHVLRDVQAGAHRDGDPGNDCSPGSHGLLHAEYGLLSSACVRKHLGSRGEDPCMSGPWPRAEPDE